jgi:predicted RNase H-like HicB family nuclease
VPYYIALIHKDRGSGYGVSFPDVPSAITVADTLDEAIERAREALAFVAEDWGELTGRPFPEPRSLDALRDDPAFRDDAADAVAAAIPLDAPAMRPAA